MRGGRLMKLLAARGAMGALYTARQLPGLIAVLRGKVPAAPPVKAPREDPRVQQLQEQLAHAEGELRALQLGGSPDSVEAMREQMGAAREEAARLQLELETKAGTLVQLQGRLDAVGPAIDEMRRTIALDQLELASEEARLQAMRGALQRYLEGQSLVRRVDVAQELQALMEAPRQQFRPKQDPGDAPA